MIYLDTNIIIYAIENHPKYGKACKKVLEDIEKKQLAAGASMLVLIESVNVLNKINKELRSEGKNQLNIREMIDAIEALPIIWLDIDFLIIEKASEYTYTINAVDYIHLATMETNGITEIISADEGFDKTSVKRTDPLNYTGVSD